MKLLKAPRFTLEVIAVLLFLPFILVFGISLGIYESILKRRKPKNISGEIALVTGGGNGLGREICFELATKGCHIAVVDIDEAGATKTVEILNNKYNIRCKAYKVDIADHDAVMQLSVDVAKDLGDVTILVNNAAIICFPSYPPKWQSVQKMLNVNLGGYLWTIEAFLPRMKELKKGHILAVSSAAALFPLVRFGVYTATKCAIRGFMRTLRLELRLDKYRNIHTTTIMPYMLNTNPKALSVFEKIGYDKDYPCFEGQEVAKTIVDAILYNRYEETVPSILPILFRIYSILPNSMQDNIVFLKSKTITEAVFK